MNSSGSPGTGNGRKGAARRRNSSSELRAPSRTGLGRVLVAAGLGPALVLGMFLTGCQSATREVGEAAPIEGLRGRSFDGEERRLGVRDAERPMLLVFWASWCESCQREMPRVAEARTSLADRLEVVPVCVDVQAEEGREFAARHGLARVTLWDPRLELADRVGVDSTPGLVLLDRDGRVVHRGSDLEEALELVAGMPLATAEPFVAEPLEERPAAIPEGATAGLIGKGAIASPPRVEAAVPMMGTEVRIVVLSADTTRARETIESAFVEMQRIETLMTDWNEGSQVSAINRAAGVAPVAVVSELFRLLESGQELSELTDGKFDMTYAGAGRLWDFKARPPTLPDPAAVAEAIGRIDHRDLVLDAEKGTAFLRRAGMRIGLGGIAKGYAVDRAVQLIRKAGFEDFAVNAGGDLAVIGRKASRLWSVGIRHPRRHDELLALLPVSNLSVATSGDYERYLEIDGERYCHILDPDTGYPARGCQSVTILAARTFQADALATGVFVLGVERGLELIESMEGVEAMIVDAGGAIHVSRGLQADPR